MKCKIVLMVGGLLVLCCGILIAASGAPAHKWEYAQLFNRSIEGGMETGFTSPELVDVEKVGVDDSTPADTRLYKAIGGTAPPMMSKMGITRYGSIDLMNAAGLQGWELISHEANNVDMDLWTFKRPI
ncbi:MAG: hypothetical protein M3O30_09540 [Planctomycetota bacterium]|nr:hypothetical protein [Planctomycetota bacterium]